MFDDRGAAIDPVAAIDIAKTVDFTDLCPMDMTADDAVEAALARRVDRCVLEIEDELHRLLDPALGVTGQRPVAMPSESPPEEGNHGIDADQRVVHDVAENCYPAVMARDLIEFVAMQEEETASVGKLMHDFPDDAYVAKGDAKVIAQGLVMIAGDEDDAFAMARPAQDLLHHRVLRLGPDNMAAHGPKIDDIADQEQVFRLRLAQKPQQRIRLTGTGAQMDIGDEDGSYDTHDAQIARRMLRR